MSVESPIWLNNEYIINHNLDDEKFENDINITLEDRDYSNENDERNFNGDRTNNICKLNRINF